MMILNFIEAILKGTPFWFWIILIYVIKKGLDYRKEGVVSVKRAFLIPVIFIGGGIAQSFGLGYQLDSLMTYLAALIVGACFGIVLYSANQTFYMKDNVFTRRGSWLPMFIILANFIVKDFFNVYLSLDANILSSLTFNIVYSILAGLVGGLILGGALNTVRKKKTMMA